MYLEETVEDLLISPFSAPSVLGGSGSNDLKDATPSSDEIVVVGFSECYL